MVRYIFCFLIILLFTTCSVSYFDSGYLIPAVNEPVSMDFQMQEDLILIDVEVNGVKGIFLLDNGFSLSAMDPEFARKANVEFRGSADLRDANNKRLEVAKTKVDTVRIQGHTFVKTGFYEIETSRFFPCYPVDGVIGASIMNKINWEFDFERQQIRISSGVFDNPGVKWEVDFINNNSNIVELSFKGQSARAKIDLGSTGGIKLDREHFRKAFSGSEVIKRTGMFSLSAAGLGAVDTAYQLTTAIPVTYQAANLPHGDRVALRYDLKYPVYVGLGYLRNYHLTINATAGHYLLHAKEPEEPDDLRSYGLAIYQIEGDWKIIQRYPDDPMVRQVKLLDEIALLDGEPISRFPDICAYKDYLREKIEREAPISLVIKGSDEIIELPYRSGVRTNLP